MHGHPGHNIKKALRQGMQVWWVGEGRVSVLRVAYCGGVLNALEKECGRGSGTGTSSSPSLACTGPAPGWCFTWLKLR